MNKKLLIVIVLVVLVAAVWWWKTQAPSYEAPGTAAPAVGGTAELDSAAAINQELDALDLGEFDTDFKAIDAELNSL